MDIGLLILRLVVGGLFIGHGTQKLFGWFGGGGLDGTGAFMESLGYRPARAMAELAGFAEAGGGTLLLLGLLTPLGAAAIIGVMLNAILSVHLPKGVWNSKGGYEFNLTIMAAAAALAFAGPGRSSLDRLIGWNLTSVWFGIGGVVVGLAAGLALNASRKVQIEPAEQPEGKGQWRAA